MSENIGTIGAWPRHPGTVQARETMVNRSPTSSITFGTVDCTHDDNAPPRLIIPTTFAPPPMALTTALEGW